MTADTYAPPAEIAQAERHRSFHLSEMHQGLIAGFLVGFGIMLGALLS